MPTPETASFCCPWKQMTFDTMNGTTSVGNLPEQMADTTGRRLMTTNGTGGVVPKVPQEHQKLPEQVHCPNPHCSLVLRRDEVGDVRQEVTFLAPACEPLLAEYQELVLTIIRSDLHKPSQQIACVKARKRIRDVRRLLQERHSIDVDGSFDW